MINMAATRLMLRLIIGCLVVWAAPNRAQAQMRDAADFPSPHSRCMVASKGRILTSVGNFPSFEQGDFDVVADTRLNADPLNEFEDPSINICNEKCQSVWRQSYPALAEVGFEALQFPGRLVLHVSAVSVFRPVDQVISYDELLVAKGHSLESKISFGSDRYEASYVGRLGPNGDFGVVIVQNPIPRWVGNHVVSPPVSAMVYRWRAFADPGSAGELRHNFVGPEHLDERRLEALKLGQLPTHPPFPLFKFVFEMNGPR